MFLANPLALLFLPVYVLYINRFQIIPEERALTRTLFGTAFSAYKEGKGVTVGRDANLRLKHTADELE